MTVYFVAMADMDQIPAMLRICTLLQSARELYTARGTPAEHVFRDHLLALISDLVPSDHGAIFLIESGELDHIVYEAVALKRCPLRIREMAVLLCAMKSPVRFTSPGTPFRIGFRHHHGDFTDRIHRDREFVSSGTAAQRSQRAQRGIGD